MSQNFLALSEAVNDGYAAYSTLRQYIREGELPAFKLGGRVKIRRDDLDALLIPIEPTSVDADADLPGGGDA